MAVNIDKRKLLIENGFEGESYWEYIWKIVDPNSMKGFLL